MLELQIQRRKQAVEDIKRLVSSQSKFVEIKYLISVYNCIILLKFYALSLCVMLGGGKKHKEFSKRHLPNWTDSKL